MAQLEFRNKFEEIFFFTKVFKFNDSSASPRTPFSFSFFHHYHHYHHNHHWLSLQLIYHPTTTLGLTTPIIISASYTTNILNQPLQLPPQTYLPKPPPQTYLPKPPPQTYLPKPPPQTYLPKPPPQTYLPKPPPPLPFSGCDFHYRSEATKSGFFTSPNHPGHYPRNTQCFYYFHAGHNERVVVTFEEFDVEGLYPG